MKNLIQKLFKKDLYPELTKVGGLCIGLNNTLESIGSEIRVRNDQMKELPFAYARVEKNNKFSQIYIASEEKLFLPDFWKDGVCLANGKTENINELAKSLDFWLNNDVSTKDLSKKFEFVETNSKSLAFDSGNETEYTWNQLLNNESKSELREFIQVAIQDDILGKLFPFTSLYTLCFSRCTGYPYDTKDLPNVTPKLDSWTLPKMGEVNEKTESDNMIYVVTKNKTEFLGQGSAMEALKIVKQNLPKNITPAIKGTSEN